MVACRRRGAGIYYSGAIFVDHISKLAMGWDALLSCAPANAWRALSEITVVFK